MSAPRGRSIISDAARASELRQGDAEDARAASSKVRSGEVVYYRWIFELGGFLVFMEMRVGW